jgi:hypothetical protein
MERANASMKAARGFFQKRAKTSFIAQTMANVVKLNSI